MRLLFLGAGAIGSYLGGCLARAGHEVSFVERPEPAEIIAREGLVLRLPRGEHVLGSVRVYTSPAEAFARAEYDLLVFALKSFDTQAALEALDGLGPLPPAVSVQNGVDNEPLIASLLGAERVIAATVTSAVSRRAVGEVVVERERGVAVAARHPLARVFAAALREAGLRVNLCPDPGAMKWSKLLTNLVANASSAILDLSVAELVRDPRLFDMEMRMLGECLEVMRALGYAPVDLPGLPVRPLAWAVRHLPRRLAQPLLGRALASGRGEKWPSFHIDLYSGRGKTEVSWLNGAVVRHGARFGIPTPVNQVLTDTLEALTVRPLERGRFRHHPEALLALLGPAVSAGSGPSR